ncbi:hypothetical protein BDW22DRAFT_1488460 [Trametopsis cervina]|nr:hypothetical protein BDW22DRAFT_1488460 [Trametopsis cervina]
MGPSYRLGLFLAASRIWLSETWQQITGFERPPWVVVEGEEFEVPDKVPEFTEDMANRITAFHQQLVRVFVNEGKNKAEKYWSSGKYEQAKTVYLKWYDAYSGSWRLAQRVQDLSLELGGDIWGVMRDKNTRSVAGLENSDALTTQSLATGENLYMDPNSHTTQ